MDGLKPRSARLALGLALGLAVLSSVSCRSAPVGIDSDGSPADPRNGPAGSLAAIVFISTECPIANAMAPELARIAAAAREQEVAFVAVHSDPGTDRATAVRHARDYGLEGEVEIVLDPTRRIARSLGATVTPEAVLIRRGVDGDSETLYLGRVNDLYTGIGRRRARATRDDLADAIDAALAGRPVAKPFPPAIGCFIDFGTVPR